MVEAGCQAVYLVDSAGAMLPDHVRAPRRGAARGAAAEVAIGIHAHNNLSLAVANSVAAIEEGATIVDVTLAGIGAGRRQLPGRAADRGARPARHRDRRRPVRDPGRRRRRRAPELMPGPIVIDRLTAHARLRRRPASFLLHAVRAGERFGVDPREIIVALGERQAVVGQEDMIIDVAASLAAR